MRTRHVVGIRQKTLRSLLAGAVALGLAHSASAALLAQYNPSGFTQSFDQLAASYTMTGITAGGLSETGFGGYTNTDVLPVGVIGTSAQPDPGQYLSFTVGSSNSTPLVFTDLLYSKYSYFDLGAQQATVRSSQDNFASDVSTINVNPLAGAEELVFNLSSLAPTADPVTFRVYFYNGLRGGGDFADLNGTGRGGSGLRVDGNFQVGTVPEPGSMALLGLGLGVLWVARRRTTPPSASAV